MLPSGIAQDDKAIGHRIYSWLATQNCGSGAVPSPARSHSRLDLGVRDGMSREEKVIELEIISVPSKGLFYGLRRDSIPIGMAVSKGENADEIVCNAM